MGVVWRRRKGSSPRTLLPGREDRESGPGWGRRLLAAASTVVAGVLVLAGLYVRHAGGLREAFPGLAGPHPALTAPVTVQGYDLAEPHDPLDQVTWVLGPGYPIPPEDWAATMFRADPAAGPARFGEPGAMSLTQFTWQQPGDEVAVYQWYQWGSGRARLFYATYRDRHGGERVFAKVIDGAAGADRHIARARYPHRRTAGGAVIAVPNPP